MSLLVDVADYASAFAIRSGPALETARLFLIDSLARGFEALRDPECACLPGPLVPGAVMPGGARIPGTSLELDPAQAAFCLGVMLCRPPEPAGGLELPFARATAAIGAVLATADYVGRRCMMEGKSPPRVGDVLAAIVKVLEIQGVLAPEAGSARAWATSIHVARLAATAMTTAQLGGDPGQIVDALSYASLDASSLDTDEPTDSGCLDWVMADAVGRAVRHACQAMLSGSRSRLSARDLRTLGLADRLLAARPRGAGRSFGTGIAERIASRRRQTGTSGLMRRFQSAVERCFPVRQAERIRALFAAPERLDDLPVSELLANLVTNGAR